MSAVINQDDVKHLVDVLATEPLQRRFEQSVMEHIVEMKGESIIYPDTMKPASIIWLRAMVDKHMITAAIVSELEIRQRTRLKLTDNGKKLVGYLEQMKNAKRVEARNVNDTMYSEAELKQLA